MDSGPLLILSVILNPDAAPAAVSYPIAAKLSPDSVLVQRERVIFWLSCCWFHPLKLSAQCFSCFIGSWLHYRLPVYSGQVAHCRPSPQKDPLNGGQADWAGWFSVLLANPAFHSLLLGSGLSCSAALTLNLELVSRTTNSLLHPFPFYSHPSSHIHADRAPRDLQHVHHILQLKTLFSWLCSMSLTSVPMSVPKSYSWTLLPCCS